MRGFRSQKRTQKFLSCFGQIRQHFALYRRQLSAGFIAWREFTEIGQKPSYTF